MLSKHERHFVGTTRRNNKEKKSYMYCQKRKMIVVLFYCLNAHRKRLLYCFARAQIVLLLRGKCHYIYIEREREMRYAHEETYLRMTRKKKETTKPQKRRDKD
jgi:hypothetical protein